MAEDGKPKSPFDEAREALRRAGKQIGPGLKAAQVVLEPAARAAKKVAWDARRAVQVEKLHDQVNRAIGLDPAHEVAVEGGVYRIARAAPLRFDAIDVRTEARQGGFTCDESGRVRALEAEAAEIRLLLEIAEAAVKAGLAP